MNRYPNFIAPEVSAYGEYESPSWFLRIGTAVVVVGVGFCLFKVFA